MLGQDTLATEQAVNSDCGKTHRGRHPDDKDIFVKQVMTEVFKRLNSNDNQVLGLGRRGIGRVDVRGQLQSRKAPRS